MEKPKNVRRLGVIDSVEPHYNRLKALWVLRVLLDTDAFEEFCTRQAYEDKRVMKMIGLAACDADKVIKPVLKARLKERRGVLERQCPDLFEQKGVLMRNINALGARIGLDQCERALLAFFVLIYNEENVADIIDYTGARDKSSACRLELVPAGFRALQRFIHRLFAALSSVTDSVQGMARGMKMSARNGLPGWMGSTLMP
jgi:hypothetical protein